MQLLYNALIRRLQLSTFYNTVVCIFIINNVTKIVECAISSEQNVSKTLISLARLRRVKYGRFRLLSGRREIGAEIRELPENTGDLATLDLRFCPWPRMSRPWPWRSHSTPTAEIFYRSRRFECTWTKSVDLHHVNEYLRIFTIWIIFCKNQQILRNFKTERHELSNYLQHVTYLNITNTKVVSRHISPLISM